VQIGSDGVGDASYLRAAPVSHASHRVYPSGFGRRLVL
jgi:hypothetical protein